MEKLLNPYDKEYMKMAMLKHEETFRQQVSELHRLYQIQKILMRDITKHKHDLTTTTTPNKPNDRYNNKKVQKGLDLERPAEDYAVELDENRLQEIEDETELELTLGPVSYNRRRRKTAAEKPIYSDSAPSFSSSSTASSSHHHHMVKGTSSMKEEELSLNYRQRWDLEMPPLSSSPSARKNTSQVEEHFIKSQDRLNNSNNNPPWLYQVLSLNMT